VARTWYHADHLHSATVITDVAGLEVRRLAYRAFGEEVQNTGSGDAPPYTYTGKELDDTGLMYYGARYYDPVLCRFVTPDIVYDAGPQGLNRYSYALNNPIIYRDPTGHQAMAPIDWWRIEMEMNAMHNRPIMRDLIGKYGDAGGLIHMALSHEIQDYNLDNNPRSARTRLDSILFATGTYPEVPMHFNEAVLGKWKTVGDTGFRSELQDSRIHPWSSRQVGHFLTAVDLGLSFSKNKWAVGFAVGHEFVADAGPNISLPLLIHSSEALFAASDEDIKNFLNGDMSKITIDVSQEGNSYQDLVLTRIGYLLSERIQDETITTQENLARWIEMAITPGGTENIESGDPFYKDKEFLDKMYHDYNNNIDDKFKKSPDNR
jgi:RHS repeat-associated protein